MPRDNQGAYSLPAGSLVNVGEDIVPSQHNPPLTDIAQAMTDSLSRDGRGGMRNNLSMGGFRVTNMAPGVQPTDGVTMSQLASGAGGVPAGCIIDFAGTAAPTGWLICAGQTLSRTDYADLFAIVGTTFGAPSGSTFNIPDLRGRVSAGLDVDSGGYADRLTTPNSRTLGANGGTQTVTLTIGQMPTHSHTVTGTIGSAGAHSHTVAGSDNQGAGVNFRFGNVNGGSITTSGVGDHTHSFSGTAADRGAGEAHPNVQPTIILTKIIKASNS